MLEPAMCSRLPAGFVEALEQLLRNMRPWCELTSPSSGDSTVVWWQGVQLPHPDLSMRVQAMLCQLCYFAMEPVDTLLQSVWPWDKEEGTQDCHGAQVWWHQVPCFASDRGMSPQGLCQRLRTQRVVAVGWLFLNMRCWFQIEGEESPCATSSRRCWMWSFEGKHNLPSEALLCALLCNPVATVGAMLQEMRQWWEEDEVPLHFGASPVRWYPVPTSRRDQELLRQKMCCSLCNCQVGRLVKVQQGVWRWPVDSPTKGQDSSGSWRSPLWAPEPN